MSNSGSLNGTWRMIYNAAWQLLETRTVSGQSQTTFRQFVHAGTPSPWLGRGSGASMGGLTPASYIDDHVAMIDPAASGDGFYQYYHADALFNTMAMTDTAAQVTLNVTYEPYGAATNADGSAITPTPGTTPFMRQGIIRDWETGNDYNRHRWYGPARGRWGQRDPIGFAENLGTRHIRTPTLELPVLYDGTLEYQPTNAAAWDNGDCGMHRLAWRLRFGRGNLIGYELRVGGTALQTAWGTPVHSDSAPYGPEVNLFSYESARPLAATDHSGLWPSYCFSATCNCSFGNISVNVFAETSLPFFIRAITLPPNNIFAQTCDTVTEQSRQLVDIRGGGQKTMNHECGHICDIHSGPFIPIGLLTYLRGALPSVDYGEPYPTGGVSRGRPYTVP